MKITLTRALTRISTLISRIEDATDAVFYYTHLKSKEEDIIASNKKAEAALQRVEDLINELVKMKRLVREANSVTRVFVPTLGEMTIAQAIDTRSVLEQRKQLLEVMSRQYSSAQIKVRESENLLESSVDAMLGEITNENTTAEEIAKSREALRATKEPHTLVVLCGPQQGSVDVINDRLERIQALSEELDYTLSEVNATTFIEFD